MVTEICLDMGRTARRFTAPSEMSPNNLGFPLNTRRVYASQKPNRVRCVQHARASETRKPPSRLRILPGPVKM